MESSDETDSGEDSEDVVITSGSLVLRPLSFGGNAGERPSTSSSSVPVQIMNQDERIIFDKISEKINLKNFYIKYLKREIDTKTILVCEATSRGWSGIGFVIVSVPGSPLRVISPERVPSPLFEPIAATNIAEQLIQESNDFARTTRSLGTLFEFIDSYLEVNSCDNDTLFPHPLGGTSPISDLLRDLDISTSHMQDDGAESESSAVSSGSTASRQSSRSTTPTMSDRID
jgi:hypothetical protein